VPLDAPALPVSLVVAGRRCLVVGGGPVALRKASALCEAGAALTAVAPSFVEGFLELPARLHRRPYQPGEAASYRLVVAATGRREVDRQVSADAEAAGVLVNAVDDPASCSLIWPAVLRRGCVTVAVSTGGASPALASWLRDRIAALVGPETAVLAELVGAARRAVHEAGSSTEGLDWPAAIATAEGALAEGGTEAAARALARWVTAALGPTGSGGPAGPDGGARQGGTPGGG